MQRIAIGLLARLRADGQKEYLLVKSKKNQDGRHDLWYPAGGHIEAGEDAKAALVREIREEFGATVRPLEELSISPGDVPDSLVHWWSCEIEEGELKMNKKELAEAGYFSVEEALKLELWPATRRIFEGLR